MAWPSATYDAISRNHSNWPSLSLSQNAREGWTNSYCAEKNLRGRGGGVAKTCLVTNQLVTSCVNTDFWLDKITRESHHTRDLRHLPPGWIKRVRPSKKVRCSELGLCSEMSLVFDFGQGLRCGLSTRHCRCHWIMAAWFVFLHFFLVPLCWYAVSERQMFLFFLREV